MFNHIKDQKMKFIKISEVMALTSLARSTVYKFASEGRFPKQVALGANCVAWVEQEVLDWIAAKIEMRNNELNI